MPWKDLSALTAEIEIEKDRFGYFICVARKI